MTEHAVTVVIVCLVIAVQIYALVQLWLFLDKKYKTESARNFEKALEILNKNIEVSIYTNEHTEVWVKSTIKDVRSKIEALRPYLKFMPAGNSKYILRSEISTNSIYVVFGTTDNNYWPDLLHYEKWLESNNQVKENIAKYKEAQSKNA